MTDLAIPDEELSTGLEDLTAGDLQTPRLRIKHKEGVFIDSLSMQEMNKTFAIILGIVKQRVLWHVTVEEGDAPLCKSPDFESGFVNLEPTDKKRSFPWAISGYTEGDFTGSVGEGDDMRHFLSCGACKLKEWGAHPLGDKPYCNEQWTMPLLYGDSAEQMLAGEGQLALFTVQRSSLKPARAFATSFARSKTPMYSVVAEIGLTMAKKGTNEYSIPGFKAVGKTDKVDWPEFSTSYRSMRAFLMNTVPLPDDDAERMPKKDDPGTVESTATEHPEGDPWASSTTPASVPTGKGDLPF